MKLSFTTATLAAAAMLAAPAMGQVIVDNDFANGNPLDAAGPLESAFFTTSSGAGLASDNGTAGVLDFASGSSGRAIHTLFTPQTLANVGDVLNVSYTFTTPATVGTNDDFRVGLFNTGGAAGLDEDISASSGTPNPILNNLPGFSGEFDINTDDADLALRVHDINGVNDLNGPTGRLLTTTSGFDFASSGDNNGFDILADTQYTGTLVVELADDGNLIITQTLAGALVNETYTDTVSVADSADGDAGVNTTTFDFLGFSVTSGAFGSVNNVGEADNGIDFNNVSVTFTSAVVPEPASFALLAVGAAGLLGSRRRKA